jgi:hypothetical protein
MEKGIGPLLKKEVIATRVTAVALFNYTRKFMPYEAGNTLAEQTYWDITAYLLNRGDFLDDKTLLDPQTAASIRF